MVAAVEVNNDVQMALKIYNKEVVNLESRVCAA